jgi:rRNA maturation protein Nop10
MVVFIVQFDFGLVLVGLLDSFSTKMTWAIGKDTKMCTAKKWSPTDPRHFEGRTLRELQDRLVAAEKFARDHPQFEYGWHNEYRQELKRRIAEQIGK